MLEIEIPKDITKYDSKLLGPFSMRQCVGILIGSICGFIVYFLTYKTLHLQSDICGILTLLAAAPGVAIGFVKLYGMNFEDYAKAYIMLNILAPRERRFESVPAFATLYEEYTAPKDKASINAEKKRLKKQKKKPKMKNNSNPQLIGYL